MTLAIVAALHEELAAVLALMPDEQRQRLAGRDFWCGHLHGREVVAVLSGIGKVAAASTATLLAARFGVSAMVFTGLAGGLGPGVRVGDVVVACSYLQHDLDATPLFPQYEVPGTGLAHFATDPGLTADLARAAQATLDGLPGLLGAQVLDRFDLRAARLHQGLIVSGDRFVATTAESQALQQALPDALAVEMEGAAFAQVCRDWALPFAAVRMVSDRADDSAHVDFVQFLQQVASRYSAAVVRQLLA
jgi:adenosylhomocysteine nucleosidase